MRIIIVCVLCVVLLFCCCFCCIVNFLSTHRVQRLKDSSLYGAWNVVILKGKQITPLCDDTMIGLLTKTEILSVVFFSLSCSSVHHFDFIFILFYLFFSQFALWSIQWISLLWSLWSECVQKLNWCVITKQCELTVRKWNRKISFRNVNTLLRFMRMGFVSVCVHNFVLKAHHFTIIKVVTTDVSPFFSSA